MKIRLFLLNNLLILSLITLAGCGFHLQRNALPLDKKYPHFLLVPSGSNSLYQALRRAFIASGIHVIEAAPDPATLPQLQVIEEDLQQQPLVYGPDSELRRERLKMRVTFLFGQEKLERLEMTAERDRQLNSKQHLGDNAEKIIIQQEMQADIINQLLTYMDRKVFPQ